MPSSPEYSFGRFHLSFNIIIFILSISLMFYIIFVLGIRDYQVVLTYIASTLVSLLFFYYTKQFLQRRSISDTLETGRPEEPAEYSSRKYNLQLILLILLIFGTPIVILFLIPGLWLMILSGMVAGASLSEFILYANSTRR